MTQNLIATLKIKIKQKQNTLKTPNYTFKNHFYQKPTFHKNRHSFKFSVLWQA